MNEKWTLSSSFINETNGLLLLSLIIYQKFVLGFQFQTSQNAYKTHFSLFIYPIPFVREGSNFKIKRFSIILSNPHYQPHKSQQSQRTNHHNQVESRLAMNQMIKTNFNQEDTDLNTLGSAHTGVSGSTRGSSGSWESWGSLDSHVSSGTLLSVGSVQTRDSLNSGLSWGSGQPVFSARTWKGERMSIPLSMPGWQVDSIVDDAITCQFHWRWCNHMSIPLSMLWSKA